MPKSIDKVIHSTIVPSDTNVMWYDGKFLKIFKNGRWVSINENKVDRELNPTSENPVRNSTVYKELHQTNTKVDSILNGRGLDMGNPIYDLREKFELYNLDHKLDTQIKVTIEEGGNIYDACMYVQYIKGISAYKITFVLTSYIEDLAPGIILNEEENPSSYFSQVYSSVATGKIPVKAYLFTPSTGIVQSLGTGSLVSPQVFAVGLSEFDYINLTPSILYFNTNRNELLFRLDNHVFATSLIQGKIKQ